jgi:hypothetical protein
MARSVNLSLCICNEFDRDDRQVFPIILTAAGRKGNIIAARQYPGAYINVSILWDSDPAVHDWQDEVRVNRMDRHYRVFASGSKARLAIRKDGRCRRR